MDIESANHDVTLSRAAWAQEPDELKLLEYLRSIEQAMVKGRRELVSKISTSLDNTSLCDRMLYRNEVIHGKTFWRFAVAQLLKLIKKDVEKKKFNDSLVDSYFALVEKFLHRCRGIEGINDSEMMLKIVRFCLECLSREKCYYAFGPRCCEIIRIVFSHGGIAVPEEDLNFLWNVVYSRLDVIYQTPQGIDMGVPNVAQLFKNVLSALDFHVMDVDCDLLYEFFDAVGRWFDLNRREVMSASQISGRRSKRDGLVEYDRSLLEVCIGFLDVHGYAIFPILAPVQKTIFEFVMEKASTCTAGSALRQYAAYCAQLQLHVLADYSKSWGGPSSPQNVDLVSLYKSFFGDGTRPNLGGGAFQNELKAPPPSRHDRRSFGYYRYLSLASALIHFMDDKFNRLFNNYIASSKDLSMIQLFYVLFWQYPVTGPHLRKGYTKLINVVECLFEKLGSQLPMIASDRSGSTTSYPNIDPIWILHCLFPLAFSSGQILTPLNKKPFSVVWAKVWNFVVKTYLPLVMKKYGATGVSPELGMEVCMVILDNELVDPQEIQVSFLTFWEIGIFTQPPGDRFSGLFNTMAAEKQHSTSDDASVISIDDVNLGFRNAKEAAQFGLPHVAMKLVREILRYVQLNEVGLGAGRKNDNQRSSSSSSLFEEDLSPCVSRRETILRWTLKWLYFISSPECGAVPVRQVRLIASLLVILIRSGDIQDVIGPAPMEKSFVPSLSGWYSSTSLLVNKKDNSKTQDSSSCNVISRTSVVDLCKTLRGTLCFIDGKVDSGTNSAVSVTQFALVCGILSNALVLDDDADPVEKEVISTLTTQLRASVLSIVKNQLICLKRRSSVIRGLLLERISENPLIVKHNPLILKDDQQDEDEAKQHLPLLLANEDDNVSESGDEEFEDDWYMDLTPALYLTQALAHIATRQKSLFMFAYTALGNKSKRKNMGEKRRKKKRKSSDYNSDEDNSDDDDDDDDDVFDLVKKDSVSSSLHIPSSFTSEEMRNQIKHAISIVISLIPDPQELFMNLINASARNDVAEVTVAALELLVEHCCSELKSTAKPYFNEEEGSGDDTCPLVRLVKEVYKAMDTCLQAFAHNRSVFGLAVNLMLRLDEAVEARIVDNINHFDLAKVLLKRWVSHKGKESREFRFYHAKKSGKRKLLASVEGYSIPYYIRSVVMQSIAIGLRVANTYRSKLQIEQQVSQKRLWGKVSEDLLMIMFSCLKGSSTPVREVASVLLPKLLISFEIATKGTGDESTSGFLDMLQHVALTTGFNDTRIKSKPKRKPNKKKRKRDGNDDDQDEEDYNESDVDMSDNDVAKLEEVTMSQCLYVDGFVRTNWFFLCELGCNLKMLVREIFFLICVSSRRPNKTASEILTNEAPVWASAYLNESMKLRSHLFRDIMKRFADRFGYASLHDLFNANSEYLLTRWFHLRSTLPCLMTHVASVHRLIEFPGNDGSSYFSVTKILEEEFNEHVMETEEEDDVIYTKLFSQFPLEVFGFTSDALKSYSMTIVVPVVLPIIINRSTNCFNTIATEILRFLDKDLERTTEGDILTKKSVLLCRQTSRDIVALSTLKEYLEESSGGANARWLDILKTDRVDRLKARNQEVLQMVCRVVDVICPENGSFGMWRSLKAQDIPKWLTNFIRPGLSLTELNLVEIFLHLAYHCEVNARIDPSPAILTMKSLLQEIGVAEVGVLHVIVHCMLRLMRKFLSLKESKWFNECLGVLEMLCELATTAMDEETAECLSEFLFIIVFTSTELLSRATCDDFKLPLENILTCCFALKTSPSCKSVILGSLTFVKDKLPDTLTAGVEATSSRRRKKKRLARSGGNDELNDLDPLVELLNRYGGKEGRYGEGMSQLMLNPSLYGPVCVEILTKVDCIVEQDDRLQCSGKDKDVAGRDKKEEFLGSVVWTLLELLSLPGIPKQVQYLVSKCLGKIGLVSSTECVDLFKCSVDRHHTVNIEVPLTTLNYLAQRVSSEDVGIGICAAEGLNCMISALGDIIGACQEADHGSGDSDANGESIRKVLVHHPKTRRILRPFLNISAGGNSKKRRGTVRNLFVEHRIKQRITNLGTCFCFFELSPYFCFIPAGFEKQLCQENKPLPRDKLFIDSERFRNKKGDSFDTWISALTFSLCKFSLSAGQDEEEDQGQYAKDGKRAYGIADCFNLCALDPNFAKLVFPILISAIVQEGKLVDDLAKEFDFMLRSFTFDKATYTFDVVRLLFGALCFVRKVDMERLRVMDPLLVKMDLLLVARAALLCDMPTTAIVHVELWYNHKATGEQKGGEEYFRLLIDSYNSLGKTENLRGVGTGTSLVDAVVSSRLQGDWKGALLGLDGVLQGDRLNNDDRRLFTSQCADSLRKLGLYKMFSDCISINMRNTDAEYESGWRFLKLVRREPARSNENFHYVLYQLLGSIVDGDLRKFQTSYEHGQGFLLQRFQEGMVQKENTKAIYDLLRSRQQLHELFTVWHARWSVTDSCNSKQNTLAQITSLVSGWDDAVVSHRRLGFDEAEPLLALRTSILRSISRSLTTTSVSSSVEKEHLLFFSSFARRNNHPELARNILHTLIEENGSPEFRLEEASVLWANGERQYAIRAVKRLIREFTNTPDSSSISSSSYTSYTMDSGNTFARALSYAGSWLADSHSASFQTIHDEFLAQAVRKSEECENDELKAETYLTIARYVDKLYRGLHTRVTGTQWKMMDEAISRQQRLVERTKRIVDSLGKKKRRTSTTLNDEEKAIRNTLLSQLETTVGTQRAETQKKKSVVALKSRLEREHRQSLKELEEMQDTRRAEKTSYHGMLKRTMDAYAKVIATSKSGIGPVFRFISLWFDHSEKPVVNEVVQRILGEDSKISFSVFVPIVYQITSRIGPFDEEGVSFRKTLYRFLLRLGSEHPLHTVPHLYALANADKIPIKKGTESETESSAPQKAKAGVAQQVLDNLGPDHTRAGSYNVKRIVEAVTTVLEAFANLAPFGTTFPNISSRTKYREAQVAEKVRGNRVAKDCGPYAKLIQQYFDGTVKIPVPTSDIPINVDGVYDISVGSNSFVGCGKKFKYLGSGKSIPKDYTAKLGSGKTAHILIKSDDDTRQDAVVQQLFKLVQQLLFLDPQTSQSRLRLRTYNVVPLSRNSGLIEFVPNTISLASYLYSDENSAHDRHNYMINGKLKDKNHSHRAHAMRLLGLRGKGTKEQKYDVFTSICDQVKPVFHHFFLEKFVSPVEWYMRRSTYSKSVGVNSMVGYIFGVGDRHLQNILVDSKTCELVHIDFGICFEAGKMLHTPETVPFRLTRDIVDGMGVTGTDGMFLASCHDTLSVLRKNTESLLTICNVFLHDPLHSWTLNNIKQQKQEENDEDNNNGTSSSTDGVDTAASKTQADVTHNIHAHNILLRVQQKLQGREDPNGDILGIEGQVSRLINEARDEHNLCMIYAGWLPFY